MSVFEIERLLEPISPEAPCGENLEYDADLAAHLLRRFDHVVAGDDGAACLRRLHGGQYAELCGLAAAVGTKDAEKFALGYFK